MRRINPDRTYRRLNASTQPKKDGIMMQSQATQPTGTARVFPFVFEGGVTLIKAFVRERPPEILDDVPAVDEAAEPDVEAVTAASEDVVSATGAREPFTRIAVFAFEGGIAVFDPEDADACLPDAVHGASAPRE